MDSDEANSCLTCEKLGMAWAGKAAALRAEADALDAEAATLETAAAQTETAAAQV